jgi:mono/diheme cytochrome c family protein
MKNVVKSSVVFTLAAATLLAPISSLHAQTASAANLAAGKTLFNANCASCHLASGAGGVHFGSAVSADLQAPDLEQTYRGDDKLIVRAILQAKDQDDAPLDQPMPAWAGKISPTQAAQIVAYLHTLHS